MEIKIADNFRLQKEKESVTLVREKIELECVFSGTNLWILFFAILIASLGLNINSSAVVIGAMLISPLMGPIVGVGFGLATNDVKLITKASRNYLFAALVGLIASTIYFLISPIDDAHSEILSRTAPTIYDVLIALFGGFAGIIAISSKVKGNVIPGVAIATALMPPLCTAGYGLATWQLDYSIGAIYLFLINSVFISVATIVTTYFLKYPIKKYANQNYEKREKLIILVIIVITLVPSIYLGVDIVEQSRFSKKADQFIDKEANFENDYLLKKDISNKNKTINLTYGGKEITKDEIEILKSKMKYYDLNEAELNIIQGFAILKNNQDNEQLKKLSLAIQENEKERQVFKEKIDSLQDQKRITNQIYLELKTQFPDLINAVIQPATFQNDSLNLVKKEFLVLLNLTKPLKKSDTEKLKEWLKVRLNKEVINLVVNSANN
jgi:uncharacterized hydrophobic protein (TIGR00271 family)